MVFLDFQKAFDRVLHSKLILKLLETNINRSIIKWISYFLQDRTQRVVLNGKISDVIKVPSGVPQGTIIAPILFSIYVRDLFSAQISSQLLAYADDMKVFASVSPTSSLAPDLAILEKWCINNDVLINIHKSGVPTSHV